MHEVCFDEELKRPVNGRWRSPSTFTIEAIQDLIGSGRLVAAPDQLKNAASQPCQAEPPGTADVFCPLQCGLDTILVVVMRRRKADCGRYTVHYWQG